MAEVAGVTFDNYVGWLVMTFALTLTSCPSISRPGGFNGCGMPVDFQILGPPRGEATLLSDAALLEEATNLADRVPLDPRVR